MQLCAFCASVCFLVVEFSNSWSHKYSLIHTPVITSINLLTHQDLSGWNLFLGLSSVPYMWRTDICSSFSRQGEDECKGVLARIL